MRFFPAPLPHPRTDLREVYREGPPEEARRLQTVRARPEEVSALRRRVVNQRREIRNLNARLRALEARLEATVAAGVRPTNTLRSNDERYRDVFAAGDRGPVRADDALLRVLHRSGAGPA